MGDYNEQLAEYYEELQRDYDENTPPDEYEL